MARVTDATGGKAPQTRVGSSREAAPLASAEARRRMVAEAAYYRAQARGFQGGDPLEDWLAAEAEIDRALSPDYREREEAAYDRLRAEAQKGLAAIRRSVDAQAIQDTIERAANRGEEGGRVCRRYGQQGGGAP